MDYMTTECFSIFQLPVWFPGLILYYFSSMRE